MNVAVVVLAAGASERMGKPKQLLEFEGKSLVRRIAERAVNSPARRVFVVVGSCAEAVARELDSLPVRLVENSAWREGIGSSIRAGIEAVQSSDESFRAALIVACDQPFVTSELFGRMMELQDLPATRIVACRYAGTVGIPALFDASLFPELLALQGDAGAKKIIAAHVRDTRSVPFPEGAIDFDRPEDVAGVQGSGFSERR